MQNQDVFSHVDLDQDDVTLLKKISKDLHILADLSRADVLMYCRTGPEEAITVAQARPHSFSPLYDESRVGVRVGSSEQPEVLQGLGGRLSPMALHTVTVRGATVARLVMPIRNPQGRILAVVARDAYWLAHERQRRRSKVFQDAIDVFTAMVVRGELNGVEALSPFDEHDGIMFVGSDRRVHYMSGIASELYRHLGYRDSLIARRVSDIETVDHQLMVRAINERRCIELESVQDDLTWIRKAIPVMVPESRLDRMRRRLRRRAEGEERRLYGVFILIHDVTAMLRTQRELESKMALIREVHHRVKNNLQVIASLMRMQARRVEGDEARAVLEESVNRILSVAVVHEFLSQNARGTINLREIAHRIMGQVKQGLLDPSAHIELVVRGPDIWLPAERATQCALIINELVQNAIEHGMEHRDHGSIMVELIDHGEKVDIMVTDDGEGLPEGFSLDTNANLGLRIVRSMAERDLRGQFELQSTSGTQAIIHFEKSALGGGD